MKKRNKIIIILVVIAILVGISIFLVIRKLKNDKINEYKEQIKKYISNIEKLTKSDGNILSGQKDIKIDLDEELITIIEETKFKPISGNFNLDSSSSVKSACFIAKYKEDNYKIKVNKDIVMVKTDKDCDNTLLSINNIKKENGEIIYFNPENGKKCSLKDYTDNTDASTTGNAKGCMKWYVFLDKEGSTKVNLLLDHNTTALVGWAENSDNSNGPSIDKKVLKSLKEDTSSWIGLEDRTDTYILNMSDDKKYQIDYTGYKARLISASEIAKISSNEKFDIKTSNEKFYFGSNLSDDKTKRLEYKWLIDSLGGCFDLCDNLDSTTYREKDGVARSIIYGYWTSSIVANSDNKAWLVYNDASLSFSDVTTNAHYGVRPVITVKKSIIY